MNDLRHEFFKQNLTLALVSDETVIPYHKLTPVLTERMSV